MSEPYEIAIDLERSFAELSEGVKNKRITLCNGEQTLDEYFWIYGKVCYEEIKSANYSEKVLSQREYLGCRDDRSDYSIYVDYLLKGGDILVASSISTAGSVVSPNHLAAFLQSEQKKWGELHWTDKLTIFSRYWGEFSSVATTAKAARELVVRHSVEQQDDLSIFFKEAVAVLMLYTLNKMVREYQHGEILEFGRLATLLHHHANTLLKGKADFDLALQTSIMTQAETITGGAKRSNTIRNKERWANGEKMYEAYKLLKAKGWGVDRAAKKIFTDSNNGKDFTIGKDLKPHITSWESVKSAINKRKKSEQSGAIEKASKK